MTREEALFKAKNVLDEATAYEDSVSYVTGDDREWLDMAIKALGGEPCEDAIDRAEAMTVIMMFAGNVKSDEEDIYIKVSDAVELLRELPSVTSQPKTGHWIEHKHNGIAHIECSECSSWFLREHLLRNSYCPNCGAKMESEE